MEWAIGFSIVFIMVIINTVSKHGDNDYAEYKPQLKRCLIRQIIGGALVLLGIFILDYCFSELPRDSEFLIVIAMLSLFIGVPLFVVFWAKAPNSLLLKNDATKQRIDKELEEQGFMHDKALEFDWYPHSFKFDTKNKCLALYNDTEEAFTIYDAKTLHDVQVMDGSNTVANSSSGLGRAIVGGAIAGGAGAVIGMLSKKDSFQYKYVGLKLVLVNNSRFSYKNVELLNVKEEEERGRFKVALDFANRLQEAIRTHVLDAVTVNYTPAANETQSIPERLRELSKLKDEGVITESEFTAKKRELLSAI